MEKVPSINNTTPYFQFPPGFRFHPSDEELIVHYLRNKVTSRPLPASVAAEIDLYKYNPWELPKKALFGEGEWYFFSPRDRKYPKGERPNRAAGLGYWKAAGIDRPIFSSVGPKQIGVKKSLVFYAGRPPKGTKTDWYMNEYRLHSSIKPPKLKGSMRLDDWVLCRVRCKGNMPKNTGDIQDSHNTELLMRLPIPNVEKTNFASANRDMISDYISKDCILLAWILSGQPVHLADTNIPKVNFEGSQNGNSLNGYNRGNSPIVSPMDNNFSNFSLLNGETSNEQERTDNKSKNEYSPSNNTLAKADIYGYFHNQSRYDILNANIPVNFNHKFQELNELHLTGRYLHSY